MVLLFAFACVRVPVFMCAHNYPKLVSALYNTYTESRGQLG